MKKSKLSKILRYIHFNAPKLLTIESIGVFSPTSVIKRRFKQFFSFVLILFFTVPFVKANNALPSSTSKSLQYENDRARAFVKGRANIKLSTDITLEINNYATTDVDIWFYNNDLDTFYYVNVPPLTPGFSFVVPEGNYDVDILPNNNTQSHTVWLGSFKNGYGNIWFYNVNLNAGLNVVTIE